MTEPMKTREEILRAKFSGLSHKIVTPVHPVQKALIVAAMQEYAAQQVEAERERIKRIIIDASDRSLNEDYRFVYKLVAELIDSL